MMSKKKIVLLLPIFLFVPIWTGVWFYFWNGQETWWETAWYSLFWAGVLCAGEYLLIWWYFSAYKHFAAKKKGEYKD